jgi:hypothetical protein
MEHKKAIAVEIALQTHVLKTCPIHNQIFCDDDVDPSGAFALAVELVKQHTPYVGEFHDDAHELTDLLSATIGAAPTGCPGCAHAEPELPGLPLRRHELANAAALASVLSRAGIS